MLEFSKVSKSFPSTPESIHVLKNVSFRVESGEFVAIIGPSGSGKSTLLGMAAGLDQPDTGNIHFDGIDLTKKSEKDLAKLRSEKIGFIFQNFQLLPGLNAIENVGIPLYLNRNIEEREIHERAKSLLKTVSMDHRANHFPKQLSGGEEQRVAIARAFINQPKIIFADEPTANLDSKNSAAVLDLLLHRNKAENTTLVIVTHDPAVAKLADRILEMKDGELFLPKPKKPNKKAMIAKKKRR
ncbi:ABC transporter ATP-binding protein [Leptospira ryugenii]|uniref:ABC transporter ATP-binding protein n=1 Tax=Leptospira ryugenii TaxID=1917863 RepID=A0A2P2E2H6_9LEPT|nr:ABC transporter ATP-binding protein [Leptospira ryugenii]GBF51102.1 ABC transporter ATP-binding protein [Leptospira ryugenii]